MLGYVGSMRRLWSQLVITLSLALVASLMPCALAKMAGVVLQPKNETEKQAADLLIQGSQLLRAKQPFKARPLLEKAVQMWPAMSHGWFNMGLCYGEIGQFEKAIAAYKEAYRLDRKLTEVLPNIGSCYQLMNRPLEGLPYFQEYLKKEPHAPDAAQVQGLINSLRKHVGHQIDSDPQSMDYLQSVCPSGKLQRWPHDKLPLRIFISNGCDESGRPVEGFREYYNEILVDAIEAWMKASGGRLAYNIVEHVGDANIVCTWTDNPAFLRGEGNAVEQGVAKIDAKERIGAREARIEKVHMIVMIKDVQKPQNNISDDLLKMACMHEFGHSLGLVGHSTNNRDVMFFSESPTVWAALTKRDKATIARLYSDYPIRAAQPAAQFPQYQQQQFQYQQPYQQDQSAMFQQPMQQMQPMQPQMPPMHQMQQPVDQMQQPMQQQWYGQPPQY
jgi:tetratricopeptide (TPR) repeat protein